MVEDKICRTEQESGRKRNVKKVVDNVVDTRARCAGPEGLVADITLPSENTPLAICLNLNEKLDVSLGNKPKRDNNNYNYCL